MRKEMKTWQIIVMFAAIMGIVALVSWLLSMASWVGALRWPTMVLWVVALLSLIAHLILSSPKLMEKPGVARAEKICNVAGYTGLALALLLRLAMMMAGY